MDLTDALQRREQYRATLDRFRGQERRIRKLPDLDFFLFGMGPREKLLYQGGELNVALTGNRLRRWEVAQEVIMPSEYAVWLFTRDGETVEIREDEAGIWLKEGGQSTPLSLGTVRLPSFEGHPWAAILRVLHQEILINILDGKPLPNFFAYRKPWYRDSAMMAMVLRETGNLHLIEDWIRNLSEPYDGNNAGEAEPDNLGQALFLISLVADRAHPLVPVILEQLAARRVKAYICGHSDFAEHPVYQTIWAKIGLQALGLPDPFIVPALPDSYASLTWWDRNDPLAVEPGFCELDYPYLDWAEAHFFHTDDGPLGDRNYPLTWEANASQADYSALEVISPLLAKEKLCAPHTWHAAEVFLKLISSEVKQS